MNFSSYYRIIILTVYTDLGIFGISISYILANIIALIYEYHVLRKHITKPHYEFDKSYCKEIILVSLPFAITWLLYTINYSIDMLG